MKWVVRLWLQQSFTAIPQAKRIEMYAQMNDYMGVDVGNVEDGKIRFQKIFLILQVKKVHGKKSSCTGILEKCMKSGLAERKGDKKSNRK